MSGLEVNKILASIILAVLIVTLIGHFGDLVIDIDHDEKKETAYKIDCLLYTSPSPRDV